MVSASAFSFKRSPGKSLKLRLSAEGLIDFSSSHRAAVPQWTDADMSELFRLRSMLESYAASLAAANISDEQIQELKSLQTAMEQAATHRSKAPIKNISALNNQFHKIILDASGNRRLVTLMSGLIEMAVILRTYHRYSQAELERSLGHHREIISAFEAHDGEWASSVMTSHILAARASYMRHHKPIAAGQGKKRSRDL